MNHGIGSRALILGILATAAAAAEDFYRAHLQSGVEIGMSIEALQAARPAAFISELGTTGRDTARIDMMEIRRERMASSWYHFRNRKLAGVTESIKTAGMPIEHTQAAVTELAGTLKSNFALEGYDDIVRSADAVVAVLTAQRWADNAKGLQLYFVATNQEITIAIFDPNALGRSDFFSGPEMLEKARANAENVRRMLGAHASTPLPIIDLLGKEKDQSQPMPSADTSPHAPSVKETALPATAAPPLQPAETATKPVSTQIWVACGIVGSVILLAFLLRGGGRSAARPRTPNN